MLRVSFIAILLCQIFFASAIFTENDCLRDVETQPACRAYFRVFKWDQTKQECIEAVYGGCHATANNFQTKAECEKYAAPICKNKQHDFEASDCTKGVEDEFIQCRARIPVFTWDETEQKCVSAIYGGCNPTNNNFQSLEDCRKYAEPVCRKTLGDHLFEAEDCYKGVESGPMSCLAYIPVYTWSHKEGKCVKAIYGGCNATPNNFKSEEECQNYAAPVCKTLLGEREFQAEDCNKGVENGEISCRGYFPVFTWNQKEQKCVKAIYGGCDASPNNFRTEEECEKYAAPICRTVLGERIFQVQDCDKGVENGPVSCMGYFPVYTWNQKEQRCVKAVYGGCDASPNNFKTEEECQKYAAPVCKSSLGERAFQAEDCSKGVENGPISCRGYFPVYTWNQKEQKCVKAIYGGCDASPNNFKTEEECQKYAAPVCKKSLGESFFQQEDCNKGVQNGPIGCMALIPVFTWNQKEQKCVKAIYGGCNATPNNFRTEEDCQKYAAPVCTNSLGNSIFEYDDCTKEVQEGPISCDAYMPVYKWDQNQLKCVQAVYGGCGATHNNFRTLEDCEKHAAPVCMVILGERTFEVDDCNKDVEEGPYHCYAYIPVFKWDSTKQKCVGAIYGGCGATNNNFETEEECQKYAAPVCGSKVADI